MSNLNQVSLSTTQEEEQFLTFTHINPRKKRSLVRYLTYSISQEIHTQVDVYENTIEVTFSSDKDLKKYRQICMQDHHQQVLHSFGFGFDSWIIIGINTGHLQINYYDKYQEQKLLQFLKSLMREDLIKFKIQKKSNRLIIHCIMVTMQLACEWLDQLLVNDTLKKFSIPGEGPRMKVFIQCT